MHIFSLLSILATATLLPCPASAQSGESCNKLTSRPYCGTYCNGDDCGNAVYTCVNGKTQLTSQCGNCDCIDQKQQAACDPSCQRAHSAVGSAIVKRTAAPELAGVLEGREIVERTEIWHSTGILKERQPEPLETAAPKLPGVLEEREADPLVTAALELVGELEEREPDVQHPKGPLHGVPTTLVKRPAGLS